MSKTCRRIGDDNDGGGGYYDGDDKFITFTIISSVCYLLRRKAE